jgi:hypothetical protein
VFRSGEHRPLVSGTELDRIILYIPPRILDLAESLADKAGVPTVQDYCALLLMQALENERVQQKMSDFEARRGPLEGFKEISGDPEYLAEWQEQSEARPDSSAAGAPPTDAESCPGSAASEPLMIEVSQPEREVTFLDDDGAAVKSRAEVGAGPSSGGPPIDSAPPRPEPAHAHGVVPIITLNPAVRPMNEQRPVDVVLRHAGSADDWGFLQCLRRGDAVPVVKLAELAKALGQFEDEIRGTNVIDRNAAYALHRLALESQVLLTDAWPGAFDERVIAAIRTVQEAVERILSGQDIRYYPTPSAPSSEQPR